MVPVEELSHRDQAALPLTEGKCPCPALRSKKYGANGELCWPPKSFAADRRSIAQSETCNCDSKPLFPNEG